MTVFANNLRDEEPEKGWDWGECQLLDTLCGINALMMYWHNTRPDEVVRSVYTDPAPQYFEEKMRLRGRGLAYFWGQLDADHRRKLFEAAWDKYGAEVERKMERETP